MAGRKSSNTNLRPKGRDLARQQTTELRQTQTENIAAQKEQQAQAAEAAKQAEQEKKAQEEAAKQEQLARNLETSRIAKAGDTAVTTATNRARLLEQQLENRRKMLDAPVERPELEVDKISRAGVRDVAGGPAVTQAGPTMAAGSMDAATIAQDPQAQFRARQLDLAQALSAQARGEGPSVAQMQLQQGTEAAIAAQRAMAAGAQSALQSRELARTTASLQQQQAAQAAQLRLQEQLQAQQALAGLSESARGQDIGLASQQALLEQEAGRMNLEAQTAQAERQTQVDVANLQARVQDADRNLKAQMANQGVDLDVLKTNAAANNAAAIAELDAQLKQMGLNSQERISYMQTQAGLAGEALKTAVAQQQIEQDRLKAQAGLATELERARLGAQTEMDLGIKQIEAEALQAARNRQAQKDLAFEQRKTDILTGVITGTGTVLGKPGLF